MAAVIATSILVLPAAAIFALLAVPLNAQKIYWFVGVPLAILAIAGII